MNLLKYAWLYSIILLSYAYPKEQQLAVIFVLDQCSYENFYRQAPYFNYGLNALIRQGLHYEQAYHPHARPSTGPGHTTFSTGTLAQYHGIIGNSWIDAEGKTVYCNEDSAENAAVFSPTGLYSYGISSRLTMADTICDQLIMAGNASAAAFSLKSRSATSAAGKLGKPFWYDELSGHITSSKAYFDKLPDWLLTFNKEHSPDNRKIYQWKLAHPYSPKHYINSTNNNALIRNVDLIDKPISFSQQGKSSLETFIQLPESNKLLLDCALTWITNELQNKTKKIILWVSFSSLDTIAHHYGPNSYEYIDTLYHLDRYINNFLQALKLRTHDYEQMIVLTADHGGLPIVETLQETQFSLAQRISLKQLADDLNSKVKKKFYLKTIIDHIEIPNIYLHKDVLALAEHKKNPIINELKKNILSYPFIQNVWTNQELLSSPYQLPQFEYYFQQQYYPGRSGSLIFQIKPYVYLEESTKNTGHISPYNYDTHIPLIIAMPNKAQKPTNKIMQKVLSPQLAVTLSNFFRCGTPSCATFDALPE